jgi:solute carrier family 35 protein F5
MALKVAPLWFTSNYFYAISLEWTTIASSTVLASMGSLFAFGFATCSSIGDERITKAKFVGVMLCFMGGVATTYTDVANDNADPNLMLDVHNMRYLRHFPHTTADNPSSLWGDLAGLVSAIGYGAYTVLLRHLCPKDEKRMSMQLFFGYVGLLNMMTLLPIALWVILSPQNNSDSDTHNFDDQADTTKPTPEEDATSIHSTITWSIFLFLVLKGLLDNVLSDYLWARAVILTSATVASVSVGLTIPMAFAADILMGNHDAHEKGQIIGAVLVLLGFVFVNLDGSGAKREGDEVVEAGEIEFENNGGFDSEHVHDVNIVL